MEPSIVIKNLTKIYKIYGRSWHRVADLFTNRKRYRDFYALKDMTLTIPKGEALGILGKNGAGKSTLLKIITGVTAPTRGEVTVNGSISALLELTSGFDPELSGMENIYLKALAMGIQKKDMDRQVDKILEFADIGDYIHQPVRTYSSGMKSRLGFAISVNVDPDVLIVDEVLAVGDDVFRLKCIEKMEEFKDQGKTILFVSHSLFTVKSFCNKCVWIKDGQMMEYGPTEDVMVRYETYLKEERAKEREQKRLKSDEKLVVMGKEDLLSYENFQLLDPKGEPTTRFAYGQDISFSFDYHVKKEFRDLYWCFTLRDAETNEIYGSPKQSEHHQVSPEPGIHHIRATIKKPGLLPGKYLLSGELRDSRGALHFGYANKVPFEVESDVFLGTGLVYMDHEYENGV
ncbi:ABC transporter ATP-binding protein [Alkalibacter rhizosphaerae]|uniref:ABC transporter ATP-binding protein n=1 Tax=Alkalibacter rhizosphaerae TaxID=2815577 RepID=A0A974XID1_9FIRM|nr:ABC transporter ATP-binding protein [Alkalibacter rhizosphaerae]QSX09300.1 ABC transporter ATP-binding protein [Alkalibacter rhizosphaerae]